ncbi:ricin-type beta-trefoil lectin domain protein [Krasilnikovia sp. M28-CT-15]|uniref:ricin-type beta-trefoil lectin domain protein n=1 Tax=Krasilnikovia sp. M28-CT-15 TaxID=3373540 RepID=UPI00399D07CC
MAMLVTIVGLGLSASMVPTVVNQVVSTRTDADRTVMIDSAQTGIDVALGQLRAAVDGAGKGLLEQLPPCEMTGAVGGGVARYRVTIAYYSVDANGDPLPLTCPPLDVPLTAKLTSTGSDTATGALTPGSPGTRTVEAKYTFRTSNENVSGGQIRMDPPSNLCLDAGDETKMPPKIGDKVTVATCKSNNTLPGSTLIDQMWAYTSDLNLQLVGSQTSAALNGLCVYGAYSAGAPATFQPCKTEPPQQWSLDSSSRFQGTPDGKKLENKYCLSLVNAGAAGNVQVNDCGGGTNKVVFRPSDKVGAGMASTATGQVVNYAQFGRCMDVTGFSPTADYMIVWFCKQAPNGAIPWNQHWYLPPVSTSYANRQPERIRTINENDGKNYCLVSPNSTAAGKYATLAACTPTGALTNPAMKWTMYGDTGDPVTSYRIVDNNGYCLTPTDLTVTPADTHTDGTAKVKVAVCTKESLQKWNAPPYFNEPLSLSGINEK